MTTAREALRDERGRFLLIWVIPIILLGLVAFAPPVLNDGDTFWHIATGRWIIAHGAVPATDPFSFTFAGQPWMAHEWLSELIMAGAWLAAGWSGVMLLVGLAIAALAAVTGAWLLRWLSPLTATATLAIGLACIAPGMLARPHLFVLPLLALWTIGLLKAREAGTAPTPWLALLLAVWANMHSSFVVGAGLAAVFALEMLLDVRGWRRRTLVGWAIFLGLTGLACLATPHGIDGLTFPLKVLSMKALPQITEWLPPDFMKLTPLEVALLAGLFACFWRGVKLTAIRALILIGLVHVSLQHVRQEVLLGVVAPLILGEPLGRALGRTAPAAAVRWRMPLPQTALGAGLALAIVAGRLIDPVVRIDGPTAPITALAHVPADLSAMPVLNDYDFGGYLIFEHVRPYIDGRADMYGDAFVAEDDTIQNGDPTAVSAAIAKYRIGWAILRPDRQLVGVLDRTPGWRRLYTDKYAVVFGPSAPAKPAPPTPSQPPPAPAPTSSAHG